MSTLQEQARALGNPTRHLIYRHILESPEPVGVAALTELVGLNHNAVRQHLACLVAADLLVEETESGGRPGRPPLRYRPVPDLAAQWGGPDAYERLAGWLLEIIRTGEDPRRVGRSAGAAGPTGAGGPAGDAVDVLEREIARQGFAPSRRVCEDATVELVLERCAFSSAATQDPQTVCALHRGLAEGILEALGGGVTVVDLEVRAPRRAGCVLRLRRQDAE